MYKEKIITIHPVTQFDVILPPDCFGVGHPYPRPPLDLLQLFRTQQKPSNCTRSYPTIFFFLVILFFDVRFVTALTVSVFSVLITRRNRPCLFFFVPPTINATSHQCSLLHTRSLFCFLSTIHSSV